VLSVFADMQATTGRENGHFLDWALGNSSDFYKLTSKLLPTQITGEDGGPVITRIELVAPSAEDIALARERGGQSSPDQQRPRSPARYGRLFPDELRRTSPRRRHSSDRWSLGFRSDFTTTKGEFQMSLE
jgi:hypothetical protein